MEHLTTQYQRTTPWFPSHKRGKQFVLSACMWATHRLSVVVGEGVCMYVRVYVRGWAVRM